MALSSDNVFSLRKLLLKYTTALLQRVKALLLFKLCALLPRDKRTFERPTQMRRMRNLFRCHVGRRVSSGVAFVLHRPELWKRKRPGGVFDDSKRKRVTNHHSDTSTNDLLRTNIRHVVWAEVVVP